MPKLLCLILPILLAAACTKHQPAQAKQDSGPVSVTVAKVVTRDLQRAVDSIGTLFPFDEVLISCDVGRFGWEFQVNVNVAGVGPDVVDGLSDGASRVAGAVAEACFVAGGGGEGIDRACHLAGVSADGGERGAVLV